MTKKESVLKFFLSLLCASCVLFSLAHPAEAAEAAFEALSLCAVRIVPGVFIFMVAAKVLSAFGAARAFSRFTCGAAEKLFGCSAGGAAVIFLGLLSGYPAGAAAAHTLIGSGQLDVREAERILPFATAASPAFLLGAVGSLCGERFGAVMLASQFTSALLLLFLTRGKRPKAQKGEEKGKGAPALSVFAAAIKESGAAALNVCSYVTFFFVFSAMLFSFLPSQCGKGFFGALLAGVLEISGGFAGLGLCRGGIPRYFCGGLMLGFGGFSVLLQSADAVGDERVSMKKYLLCKCLQSAVCGVCAAFFGCFAEVGFATAAIFLFGAEQRKITAIWQIALLFAVFLIILTGILKIFLKFFALFKKIFKKLWKKNNL
jgi:hypothetical protein